jgi:hypothetical protein
VERDEKDKGDYLLVRLDKRGLPTIGANGTVFRAQFLKENLVGDYLFDIDILAKYIKEQGSVSFVKTKNGIIHLYCEASENESALSKFARKQRRRVNDFLYHKFDARDREFEWEAEDVNGTGGTGSAEGVFSLFITTIKNNFGMVKFLFSCLTVIPLLCQMIRGFLRKPDTAWFFHPIACEITFFEYGRGALVGMFRRGESSREGWGQ